jgi:hypothetical protein
MILQDLSEKENMIVISRELLFLKSNNKLYILIKLMPN